MKMRSFAYGGGLLFAWLVLATAVPAPAAARADDGPGIDDLGVVRNDTLLVTRHAVIEAALAHNEMLAASGAMTDAAGADALSAWAGYLPRLSVGAYRIRTDDALYGFGFKLNRRSATQADFSAPPMPGAPAPAPFGDALNYPGVSENNITQIKLLQPVFNGGMSLYGKRAANAMSRAAEHEHRRAAQTVRLHAVQAYEGLVLAGAYEEVLLSALASADGHLRQARAMYDNEMVTEADLLQAQVYRAGVEQRLIEVRNMSAVAGEHIKLLTALDTDLPLAPREDDTRPAADVHVPWSDDRPDVAASREKARAAANMAKATRGRLLPHLNLAAEKNWFHGDTFLGDEADSWTFGIYATWDVFSSLENVGALKKARAESRAAAHMSDFWSRQARAEAVQAVLAADAAAEKLAVAEDAVAAARESLRIVTDMYREGLASMVDLLDVQAAATMTEGNLVQARHDHRVSGARLAFTGVPSATATRE
ncbi:TolC family protein [bacterium]|nr:TolC family protein [bacterium]